ncbi:hypothetical protein BaRGS_00020005 [Batillaria attramentaria]|uniref:Ubiquitin carboxyl-terminal hydrolase MINDY n=1 Tax=Batillaria attramentaria TaxID=370345 RepID=A0ABD0KN99_9CAEN
MPPDNFQVESISESLVREYLSRKGLKSTLQVMEEECPRHSGSISNRQVLMRELHLEKLMRKNKEQEEPLHAMLEVMTKFFMEKQVVGQNEKGRLTEATDKELLFGAGTGDGSSRRTDQGRGSSQDIVIEDNLESETLLGDGKSGLMAREASDDGFSHTKTTRPMSSKARAVAGTIVSTVEESAGRRRLNKPKNTGLNNKPGLYQQTYYPQADNDSFADTPEGNFDNGFGQQPAAGNLWNSFGLPQGDVPTSEGREKPKAPVPAKAKSSTFQELLSAGEEKANKLSRRLSGGISVQPEPSDPGYSVNMSSFAQEKPAPRQPASRPGSTSKPNKVKVGDIEFGDVDDLDTELNDVQLRPTTASSSSQRTPLKSLDSKPIDTKTAIALKTVVFGSAMQYFNDEWRLQGFTFCDLPDLLYGIVQRKGGPCGVLASVQAVFLQEMLFGEKKLPQGRSLKPTRSERSQFLASALARICWRAGEQSRAVIALPSSQNHVLGSTRFRQDDVTEKLVLYTFTSFSDLSVFMRDSIQQFETDGSSGVVLCMYSAILSRGIEKVHADMDEEAGKMIGAHGYCTQELVNLLLTGCAVSNVFNDVMELDSGTGDSMILKGITGRSDIGLLSLFEHYKSCQVGTYYKTPKYPIWVVCSESHFSVLFSTRLDLVSDWKAERRFDLFYYDGLARQQEEIKLTISTTSKFFRAPSEDDLVPPLEHCIRTKWSGAEIDWNGYEPIL